MRLDLLVRVLVEDTLPGIFKRTRLRQREKELIDRRIRSLPGGDRLVEKFSQSFATPTPVAFFQPDIARDREASILLERKQISTPEFSNEGFTFTCYSSLALASDINPTVYTVNLQLFGQANCTCSDFQNRGGACKHIRAALLKLDQLRQNAPQITLPHIRLPTSEDDARHLLGLTGVSSPSDADLVEQAEQAMRSLLLDEEAIFEVNSATEEQSSTLSDDEPSVPDDNLPLSQSEIPDYSRDEYDIPVLHGPVRLGVDDQSSARVFRDLQNVAPKLLRLAEYLDGVHLSKELVPQAISCRLSLRPIVDALDKMLKESADEVSMPDSPPESDRQTPGITVDSMPPLPTQQLSEPRFASIKRTREDILPPSPEKGSAKRHQSYSVD